jgi:RNA polymerase sigma-70 factor (ECF subfamily)
VILLWLEEKSYAEIAEITGLTSTNVGVRLTRIKNRLKSHESWNSTK